MRKSGRAGTGSSAFPHWALRSHFTSWASVAFSLIWWYSKGGDLGALCTKWAWPTRTFDLDDLVTFEDWSAKKTQLKLNRSWRAGKVNRNKCWHRTLDHGVMHHGSLKVLGLDWLSVVPSWPHVGRGWCFRETKVHDHDTPDTNFEKKVWGWQKS